MKIRGVLVLVLGFLAIGANLWSQPIPVNREPVTTLRLPATAPTFGYTTELAFGALSFADPVAVMAPPGETNRLFIVEQNGIVSVITNLANPTRTVFLNIVSRVDGGVPSDE